MVPDSLTNGRRNDWLNKWTNEQTNKQMNEWIMNQSWINDWMNYEPIMNQWMNELWTNHESMRMRSIEQKKVFKDVGFLLCCSLQQAAWCIVRRCTDIRYENAEHRDASAACLCLVSVAALSSNKRKIKNHTSKYRVPLFGKVVRGIFLGKFSSTKVILIQRALYFGG